MVGSAYVSTLRISYTGLFNLSGFDSYLISPFTEFNVSLTGACNQFSALYGDGIFPQLAIIVARDSSCGQTEA